MPSFNSLEDMSREPKRIEVVLIVAFFSSILVGILYGVSRIPMLTRVAEFGFALLILFAAITFVLRALTFRTFGLPSRETFARVWKVETAIRQGLFGERSLTARQRINPLILPTVMCLACGGLAYTTHQTLFYVATVYFFVHLVVAQLAVHVPPSLVFLASSGSLATEAHEAIGRASAGCFRIASRITRTSGSLPLLTQGARVSSCCSMGICGPSTLPIGRRP